ncbi:MAG TPA: hypothetical protein IGS52_13045 [Oscillatoriaceae cyanobacterium M33_DOE_052]|uniref:Uncharacterized protein n=1 Tax=Planktothricoides sp. SpSt-374 TaxID=2282167 RepID=A0A7C3VEG7_9CYAN|nr:hypothetical protein [Oscillatoriaceae cyanobacterium M33_DOE_052]
MTNGVKGEMTWKPEGVSGKLLYLRLKPFEPWRSYKEFPQYFRPDPPTHSQGYATFLHLLRSGWKVIT